MRLISTTKYILFFLTIISAFAVETSISMSVDRSEITIGDRVKYDVTVKYPADCNVITPSLGSNLGMFEIQDFHAAASRCVMIITSVAALIGILCLPLSNRLTLVCV